MTGLRYKFNAYIQHKIPGSFDHFELKRDAPAKNVCKRYIIDTADCMFRFSGGNKGWRLGGGDWNYLTSHLNRFYSVAYNNNIQFILFFDGTGPIDNSKEWEVKQASDWNKANNLYTERHSNQFQDWLETPFLRQMVQYQASSALHADSLKNDRRHNIFVFNTIDDHAKEIIEFCAQHKFDGIFTENFELITLFLIKSQQKGFEYFNHKSIFLSRSLHFSEAGFLADEFNLTTILCHFRLNVEQFAWFNILLGSNSRWFPDTWLFKFYKNLIANRNDNFHPDSHWNEIIKALASFIVECGNPVDFNKVAKEIFEQSISDQEYIHRMQLFRANLDYLSLINNPARKSIAAQSLLWIINRNDNETLKKHHMNIQFRYYNNMDFLEDKVKESEYYKEIQNQKSEKFETLQFVRFLHINCQRSVWINSIISKSKLYLPVTLEPKNTPLSEVEIFRPIRKACYNLLYSDIQKYSSDRLAVASDYVTEVFLDHKTGCVQNSCVRISPSYGQHSIINLWDQFVATKYELFFKCINSEDTYDQILADKKTFENPLLIPCLVIRFIMKMYNAISENEMKAFVLTFGTKTISQQFQGPHSIESCEINNRAVYLATLFIRGIETFEFLNSVCGCPFPIRMFRIDKYFNGNNFNRFLSALENKQTISFTEYNSVKSCAILITKGLPRPIPPKIEIPLIFPTMSSLVSNSVDNKNTETKSENAVGLIGRGRGMLLNKFQNSMNIQSRYISAPSSSNSTRPASLNKINQPNRKWNNNSSKKKKKNNNNNNNNKIINNKIEAKTPKEFEDADSDENFKNIIIDPECLELQKEMLDLSRMSISITHNMYNVQLKINKLTTNYRQNFFEPSVMYLDKETLEEMKEAFLARNEENKKRLEAEMAEKKSYKLIDSKSKPKA